MKRLLNIRHLFLLIGLSFLFMGSQSADAQGTQLLREPTVSDTDVVFVYANDLWIVDRDGGDAQRLTSAEGLESYPHFSPDGRWVAFTGQYDGNTDVFLIPKQGGEPRRLTWHPGEDVVQGWTPDGKEILFLSGRTGHPTATLKLWKVAVDGGMPEPLPVPRAAAGEISEDGRYVAYQLVSFWDPEWRNYRGGQAKPIWIVDLDDLSLQTTPQTDNERHTDPVWLEGNVYFLSERDYANNIWSFDPRTETLTQVTFHVDFDVKSLDEGGGKIVYEQGGYLHLLDPGTGDAVQLVINVRGDLNWARPRWSDVSGSSLSNASLSPTGKRALFEYRGEIFTVPAEEGDWRNITQTSGTADRYPVWSPDGQKIAWFSDATGEYTLHITDQEGLEPPRSIELPNPTFYFVPDWSPDGKNIAYTDTDYQLWYVDVESGEAELVDTDRYAHPDRSMNPVWSPDSQWIAYARLLDNQLRAVKVYNVETGESLQLTDGMADTVTPVWDESGKYLYFLASTDFGLNTGWLDMSAYNMPVTRALYMIVLDDDEPSPFLPLSDDEPAEEEKEEGDEDDGDEEEGEEEEAGQQVRINMEGINQRILAIDVPVRNYAGLVAGPEEHVFYLESVPGQPGYTLHRYNLEERESVEYLKPVQFAGTSKDRKQLLYRSGSSWGIVQTTGGAKKTSDGSLSLSSVRLRIDPQDEWKQIYREGWRYQRDFLYVNNVHGAPWDEVYEWYRPWVNHVRHRTDLNYIIDILGGEVAVGHSYTSGGDIPYPDRVSIGLLGADIKEENGRYRIERIYTGENWNPGLDAPLSGPGIDVDEGDYILAVNGVELEPPTNLYSAFEGTAGRQTKIRFNDSPRAEGSRLVTVVPTASEYQLRSWAWVEGNRQKVDEMSDGKLAYVWLPNTGGGGYAYFNRYYFAQQHKKGAVIDQRNNGGGSAADYIADVMARDLHGYFNSNAGDHKPFTTPMAGLWGPKVMIINERAGSGGDLLPYLFRKMEIGPLIGTRTWGGLVGTWDTPRFIDGGRMVAPRGGFFDVNGEWAVEGEGIAPDIEVIQMPAEVAAGHDPQLERAVQEALRLLETEGMELKPEPAPPIRWRRPVQNE